MNKKETKTILIADDSPTMRSMLEDILKEAGYHCLSGEDGIEAVELAFEKQPDLIISDIEMPKMNGYQVCRLLKNDPLTRHIPIIILTSKSSSGSVFWGLQTGADMYVLKDFKPDELIGSIESLFQKYGHTAKPAKAEAAAKIDAFQIMGKLNSFLDNHLFEMTLINEINKITVTLTSISETLSSILQIIDTAITNHIIGFAILTGEQDILLSIKLGTSVPEKTLEIFEFQTLEELAVLLNQDISEYNIEVEVLGDKTTGDAKTTSRSQFDPGLIYSIPIRAKEVTFGILNVFHPQMASIAVDQKRLLENLGSYISTAISTVSMYHQIKDLSLIDGLTQLYNRRYYMETFKTEFSKSVRYQSDLSLIMLDIDDFKHINDTYGHLSGDLVLKDISKIIKTNLRNFDLPGRYGGEEFIILLPETSKDNAAIVSERIRKQVEQHSFRTMAGDGINVTISLGLSNISELENRQNEIELIKLADSRLYKAKKSGKNRTIST